MRVVVVGAGLGGLRTVEALRRKEYGGAITLIGAEPHAPYDRPPLTKHVLRGELADTTFPTDFPALDVDTRFGVRATGLDTAAGTVALSDGGSVQYDALVLAPGAVPRTLPGVDQRPGLHVVRTIEDAHRLRDAVAASGRVVVVGGGFIGCEVAASARSVGADVDLVEVLPAPLVRVLGPEGAALAADLLTERGVRIHTGTAVTEITGEDAVTGVVLGNGTRLDTRDVVVGLGVVPDLGWLDGSGIEIGDGIACDAGGRTSVPGVYALGDAAAWHHRLAGGRRRIEHWTTTVDQANVVAANIAAGPDGAGVESADVPYFWSDVFDVKIQALGFVDAEADTRVLRPGGKSVILYSRDGRLTAAVGFSAARHVMRLRGSVASGAPVDEVAASLPE